MIMKYQSIAKTSLHFIASFCCAMALLLPITPFHYKNVSEKSVELAETKLNDIKAKFDSFLTTQNASLPCKAFVRDLRQTVFHTDWVKEAAIYNHRDYFYCSTTEGDVWFPLYQTISNRIESDPNHTTLSYTNSAISQSKAIMLIFKDQQSQEGVSLLIPPHYISDIVEGQLSQYGLESKVEVIHRDISTPEPVSFIKALKIESDAYPLTVISYAGYRYYINFLLTYSWFGFLCAGVATIVALNIKHKNQGRRSLEYSLSNALKNKHLHVHLQPIVDQRTTRIVGCESLLRWNDPVEGNVSPAIFIPLAESLGLIGELTYFVLDEVLEILQWNPELFENRYISVNISRNVLSNEDFSSRVLQIYKKHPELLKKVTFEVTEDGECLERDMLKIKENLAELASVGVQTAIDDFGTGYAGLDFVRQFPFNIVKIDRVFVKNILDETSLGIPLLVSMLQLAETLGMEVIVEGVENESQLSTLAALGVNYIQGFYFYKPMPKKLAIEILKHQEQINAKDLQLIPTL
ncbi:EAL domain-containing protein [Vibrio sp. D404a]|uniref:EAL domain-containing protein n=1 Tax=unclassified Vibrio TaxID=2614977 RepID=UPI0025564DC5|nr:MULTISPECIES: EAL domain-containing protein [unclassified Vibrio]MDK9739103.1 EAL domain-containing protein [Vibrio sp. D404a]MDK9796572.1 EAL domain-containing protein [Vibrio sp. D449a]